MLELNVIHITIIGALSGVGAIIGWLLRGRRALKEKAVVSAGWQEQINAQRTEHDRLTEQNKALMEQNSQYLASSNDSKNRAKTLVQTVKEANVRRDKLQIELAETRKVLDVSQNALEVCRKERDQLKSDLSSREAIADGAELKDERIKQLKLSLESWQGRLPPLIEKFQQKNEEASRLASDLAAARERIIDLELLQNANQTIIEAVHDPEELRYGRIASNDANEAVDADGDGDGGSDSDIDIDIDIDEGGAADSATRISKNFTIEELVSPRDVLEPDDEHLAPDNIDDDEDNDDQYDDANDFDDLVEELIDDLDENLVDDPDDVLDENLDESLDDDPGDDLDDDIDIDEDLDDDLNDDLDEDLDDGLDEDVDSQINGDRDDLKLIKGIGPAIEKTLNELGIFRFQQIANMSEYDIDRIAKHLKGFRSRIYREDWIGQARDLGDQDSSD